MKKNVLAIVALAALSLTACKKENAAVETNETAETTEQTTDAVSFKIDAGASKIDWIGSKLSGSQHTGTIALQGGEVFVTDNALTGGDRKSTRLNSSHVRISYAVFCLKKKKKKEK